MNGQLTHGFHTQWIFTTLSSKCDYVMLSNVYTTGDKHIAPNIHSEEQIMVVVYHKWNVNFNSKSTAIFLSMYETQIRWGSIGVRDEGGKWKDRRVKEVLIVREWIWARD